MLLVLLVLLVLLFSRVLGVLLLLDHIGSLHTFGAFH